MTNPEASADTSSWLQRLDGAILRVEKALVAAATLVMTVMVFISVVWRVALAPVHDLAGWISQRAGASQGAATAVAWALLSIVWLGLWVFGVRTAKRELKAVQQIGLGVTLAIAAAAAGKLFVWLVPHGVVFSQRVALSLMMWVVFLGSSIAAHKRSHIAVQAAQKLVPERLLRAHASLSLLVAAAFTAFLWFVSSRYVVDNFRTWVESDFRAGVFESLAIPYWTVTVAVPFGFGMTLLRFVGQAVAIWRGKLPPLPPVEEVQAAEEATA